jgi:hypothetical protein
LPKKARCSKSCNRREQARVDCCLGTFGHLLSSALIP